MKGPSSSLSVIADVVQSHSSYPIVYFNSRHCDSYTFPLHITATDLRLDIRIVVGWNVFKLCLSLPSVLSQTLTKLRPGQGYETKLIPLQVDSHGILDLSGLEALAQTYPTNFIKCITRWALKKVSKNYSGSFSHLMCKKKIHNYKCIHLLF